MRFRLRRFRRLDADARPSRLRSDGAGAGQVLLRIRVTAVTELDSFGVRLNGVQLLTLRDSAGDGAGNFEARHAVHPQATL